jgi:hypothetical protein
MATIVILQPTGIIVKGQDILGCTRISFQAQLDYLEGGQTLTHSWMISRP